MKIGNPPNYYVQVFPASWDYDPPAAALHEGIVQLTLNVTLSITFVPDATEAGPPWSSDRHDPREYEIVSAGIAVTPNAARAGEFASENDSLIFYVSPDEFATYAAELAELTETASSSLPSVRRDDVLDRAVIRFVDEHVLEHPEVRARRGGAVQRPPAAPAGAALEEFVAAPTWATPSRWPRAACATPTRRFSSALTPCVWHGAARRRHPRCAGTRTC